ncbi:ATP/GTP-binding protein [Streptomyces sp. NPDC001530]|uniref:ATP/GTP-binding protein n=1 Tax=Streptomyces sp. NPDC001530 TaxID=3364582 RepID=UPI00367EE444
MSEARSSLSSRVAAGWARAESVVTKVLLLVIFGIGLIAQFVKPVGDALEGKAYLGGALLSLVGYVLYAEVQRLNGAHQAQREHTENLYETVQRLNSMLRPQAGVMVTPADLEAEFKEALQAGGEIHLAAMGFTGETFATPLKRILERLPPNSRRIVHIRVLVPDFTKEIEVPGLLGADGKVGDAPDFRHELVRQIAGYQALLKSMIIRMRDKDQGKLTVSFRVMHMSPSLKLYLINDDQAFEGIYDKIELRRDQYRSPEPAGEGIETNGRLLDPQGYDSLLTRWSRDDGERAREIIVRRRELFDTFWNAAHELSVVSGTNGAQPS